MSSRLHNSCRLCAIACLVLLVIAGGAAGQLLFKEKPRYENYGEQGYRQYGRGLVGRSTEYLFDEMGEFLMDGVEVYSLREDRVEAERVPAGSTMRKHDFYYRFINGLAIVRDRYKGFTTQLLVGDHIRTHFTPLTLDLAALNGIRWDLQGKGHRFSLLTSRRDRPGFTLQGASATRQLNFATYLLGGHWESKLGPINLGATFTNQYRIDSLVGTEGSSIRGMIPSNVEDQQLLVVKVANAQERLGDHVRVYDVILTLNGEQRDIKPKVTRHDEREIDPLYPNGGRSFPEWQSIPPYKQFILEQLPLEEPGPEGDFRASGTEYLLFWFELPDPKEEEDIQQASFDILVADNYEVWVSEVYIEVPIAQKIDPGQRNRVSYFSRVAGNDKAVVDRSNLRWVRFEYGRQTGNMVFGVHAETHVKGFEFGAEYNVNLSHFQYPDLAGTRHRRTGFAYFVKVKKSVNPRVSAGGEFFNIDPEYSTKITVQDDGFEELAGASGAPYNTELPQGFGGHYNNTMEMDTVDDNDDKDPFPDFHWLVHERDTDGVFPGLDANLDGRPDINENDNALPDYYEPFLLYNVDPDDFVYGDDLNNNGIIDVRENDRKPDYPYDQNRRGWHLFATWKPTPPLKLIVGRYDTWQLWGGGENNVSYAKLELHRDLPALATFRVVDFFKRVEDNIRDDAFRIARNTSGLFSLPFSTAGFNRVFAEDPLLMQDSWVNTAFTEIKLYRFRPLHLRFNGLWETNRQGATDFRGDNWLRRWSMVLRSDYTWSRGNLSVIPQVKFMTQKVVDDEGEVAPVHESFFYPIFKVEYQMTRDTVVRVGAQGFPFLKSQYRNLWQRDTSFSTQDYVVSLTNVSSYSGYQLGINVGYQLHLRRMVDRARRFEDRDYTFFFLRMVAGLRPTNY